jgi:hypothetical protein
VNISLLTKAHNLSEVNPAASNLLFDLDKAETGQDVIDALEQYDNATEGNS